MDDNRERSRYKGARKDIKMKTILALAILGLFFTWSCQKSHQQVQTLETDQIIIRYKSETSLQTMDSLAKEMNLKKIKVIPKMNIQVYQIDPKSSLQKVIIKCRNNPHVEYAEPDYQVRTFNKNK